jgi:hypothetical protein
MVLLSLVVAAAGLVRALPTGSSPAALAGGPVAEPRGGWAEGLLTFRGSPERTFLGRGPVPAAPQLRWRVPERTLCSRSAIGLDGSELVEWCGTGWTGQPNVVPGDGGVEIREGAYDGAYHFLGGDGEPVRPPLQTGDLAKGSATTDPDGFPLYYAGSRDDLLRIVALDRPAPTVLWELDANTSVPQPMWNDDWDGAPLVIRDVLFVGGENGWVYAIRLNRAYDDLGRVTVAPEPPITAPGFDHELLQAIGDDDVSIESSVTVMDGVLYVANSGGLITGWDARSILRGEDRLDQVFRFWTGDDTDATVVADTERGRLYVASEYQRFGERSRALGQLMALDPSRPDDPVLWSLDAPEIGFAGAGGSWSTPAIWDGSVFFTTAAGRVLRVDGDTGEIVWEAQIAAPAIGSPVVVDGVLVQGDCSGGLHAWAIGEEMTHRWSIDLGECVESTPAIWEGWIYVGTREGFLFGLADADTPVPGP